MSERFMGFLLSVVVLSSFYTTIDHEVYENGHIYDVLLQDVLFVIDYLILFGYFVAKIYVKSTAKLEPGLFMISYFILFLMGSLMPLFLRQSNNYYYWINLGASAARILQLTAFLLLFGKDHIKTLVSRKLLKNPLTYSFALFPLVSLTTNYDIFDIIYLYVLFILLYFCYFIYLKNPKLGWQFIFALVVFIFTEFYYLNNYTTTHPIFYLFILRIFSSAAELFLAKGFLDFLNMN